MTLGIKIKKVRELRNYTQQYMADQLNITTAGYSKIECDRVNISIYKLEKIAGILNIKLSKLLEFDESIFFKESEIRTPPNKQDHSTVNNLLIEKIHLLEQRIQDLEFNKH